MYTNSPAVTALHKQVAADYRERSKMASSGGSPPSCGSSPDVTIQRGLIEQHLLDKKLIEGDYWYIVVAEWLEQLKKYLGIASARKIYCPRSSPGPILTKKEFAHTVDVVHEDAWRYLYQWYGMAEGHRPIKMVVYTYNKTPGIEHNQNSFKLMVCNAPPEDFQIVRFSKLEKIGHLEWKLREINRIPRSQSSRLWGKSDTDAEWKPLFSRDKTIGKVLEVDSDFTRPVIAMEIQDANNTWTNCPDGVENIQEEPTGPLYDHDIFEDVKESWEMDIHEQIDGIGRTIAEKLHGTFGFFMGRAKDYIDEKENSLREREREISEREDFVEVRLRKMDEKERLLNSELRACQSRAAEIERLYDIKEAELVKSITDREAEMQQKVEALAKEREFFEQERELFEEELKRVSEMNQMQEGRIKLDIGGTQFTTSLMTLQKDPDSMLAAMFSGRHKLKTESDGSYFIDRDGAHFRYILNYLRDGGIKEGTLPNNDTFIRELQAETEYYQISGLLEYLEDAVKSKESLEASEVRSESVDSRS